MKRFILISLFISFLLPAIGQNIRFVYNVVDNGTTTDIEIYMYNSAVSGTENVFGFTTAVYYDNTESSYTTNIGNNDLSSLSSLGWVISASSSTESEFAPLSNMNIPSTHTGYREFQAFDDAFTGTAVGQAPILAMILTFDNTIGGPNGSDFYVASASEHGSIVYSSTGGGFSIHPIIVDQNNGNFPVELLTFEAKAVDGGQSLLTWTTASELNNKGFKVQRINDDPNSANWEELGFVDGMGTTDELTDYAFIDPNPRPGENLYRLQQVDFNGDFEYSEVRTVWFDQGVGVNVYPNPTSSYVNVKFEELNYDKDTANYTVQDQRGRLVFEGTVDALRISQIDFSKLPEGTYYLKLEYNGKAAVKEIVRVN